MTKQELMEVYTKERLADMVVKFNDVMDMAKYSDAFLEARLFNNPAVAACEEIINILQNKINNLEEDNRKLQVKLDTCNNYFFQDARKKRKN